MTDKLTDKSVAEFTEALSAKVSVPGGGGAAALAGALGVSLCAMAGQFTLGKKKYAAYEEDIRGMLDKAEDLRQRFLRLVEDDAAAFEPLSKAYRVPKDDPGRAEILEKATAGACAAPLKMLGACAESVELLEEMAEKGSVMMLSDVGCGALLCRAGIESAAMNVYINTGALKDRTMAEEFDKRTGAVLSEYAPRAEALARRVMDKLRGKG